MNLEAIDVPVALANGKLAGSAPEHDAPTAWRPLDPTQPA